MGRGLFGSKKGGSFLTLSPMMMGITAPMQGLLLIISPFSHQYSIKTWYVPNNIQRFYSHYVKSLKLRLNIEHFLTLLTGNMGYFKRFSISSGIFPPYYRVLFRLFRPIISVILRIFSRFIYIKKQSKTHLLSVKKVERIANNKAKFEL